MVNRVVDDKKRVASSKGRYPVIKVDYRSSFVPRTRIVGTGAADVERSHGFGV